MDLDARGARAASSLRDQVEPTLDLEGARHAVARGASRRRTRHSIVFSAAITVGVGAVMVILAALSLVGPSGESDMALDAERDPVDQAILGDLPQSPIDGRDSWRLPVLVRPQAELVDGETVTVYARGFEPGELLGVVMCAREAEAEGAGACMLGDAEYQFAHVTSAHAAEDGTVVQDVAVRRFITTPVTGEVDCASEAERCMVAIGAAANYDRSGGSYVDFAGAPDFPQPTMAVTPPGPATSGQTVHVEGRDMIPGRLNQVQQCAGDVCTTLARGFTAPDGTFAFDVVVNSVVYRDGRAVECADRCTLRIVGVGIEGATMAPQAEPVALAFGPGAPLPEDQIPPPSTTAPAGGTDVVPVPEGETTEPSVVPGSTVAPSTVVPPASGPADPVPPSTQG